MVWCFILESLQLLIMGVARWTILVRKAITMDVDCSSRKVLMWTGWHMAHEAHKCSYLRLCHRPWIFSAFSNTKAVPGKNLVPGINESHSRFLPYPYMWMHFAPVCTLHAYMDKTAGLRKWKQLVVSRAMQHLGKPSQNQCCQGGLWRLLLWPMRAMAIAAW